MYIVSNSVFVCVSSKLPWCRLKVTNILDFRSGAAGMRNLIAIILTISGCAARAEGYNIGIRSITTKVAGV